MVRKNQNRRMSKDYERLTETGEAFIYVAMRRLMARRLARSWGFSDSFGHSKVIRRKRTLPLRQIGIGSQAHSRHCQSKHLRRLPPSQSGLPFPVRIPLGPVRAREEPGQTSPGEEERQRRCRGPVLAWPLPKRCPSA